MKPTLEQLIAELVATQVREQLAKHAPDADGWISLQHAAARLDVTESFLRKQIREKRLEVYRIGACVRVRIADIDALAVPGRDAKPEKLDEISERVRRLARGGKS